jgi:hypothetical protein
VKVESSQFVCQHLQEKRNRDSQSLLEVITGGETKLTRTGRVCDVFITVQDEPWAARFLLNTHNLHEEFQ